MAQWWTYRPEDFLLFSERVYWRLFALHNADVWPAQIAALVLGALIVVLLVRPRPWSDSAIALLVAVAWLFVAWAFLWQRYRTVNWAAGYIVPFFVLEGLLFAWFGGIRDTLAFRFRPDARRSFGLAIILYALAIHPWMPLLSGRPLLQAEIFGIAPEPTAIGTLGLLCMVPRGIVSLALLVVPVLWCTLSWLTLQTMGAWEASIPIAAILAVLAAQILPDEKARPR
jgi:hypothetical protein